MRKTMIAFILISSLFALPSQGISAIYKWVDDNGVITFKDTPPPSGVKAKMFELQTTVGGDTFSKASSYPKIEIYMTKWCPTCTKAINYLNSIGVKYTKYDIDKSKSAKSRLNNKYHQNAIPYTIIGNEKILGFSRQRFESALGINKK